MIRLAVNAVTTVAALAAGALTAERVHYRRACREVIAEAEMAVVIAAHRREQP